MSDLEYHLKEEWEFGYRSGGERVVNNSKVFSLSYWAAVGVLSIPGDMLSKQ